LSRRGILVHAVSDFQRARQPKQKAERSAHVLATARAMLDEGLELSTLSLNELARRAGMAKSNVYRYFETREAVLLALLWEEWGAWYEHMAASYRRPARGRPALDALVRHLARTLAARPLLCALTTALPSVLEHNLSEEAIRSVKTDSLESFREIGGFLASRVPELSAEEYVQLLYDAVCIVAGLYPMAFPSEPVARVVAAPEFALFRRDLRRDLERFLLALARDRVAHQKQGET
jgi:AcrR family transcriptional regulator